jgi:hypothetical protein
MHVFHPAAAPNLLFRTAPPLVPVRENRYAYAAV